MSLSKQFRLMMLIGVVALCSQARAAFHLWAINEVYTNNSGSLQFIELNCQFGSQNFVNGMQIQVSNGPTPHTFTIPGSQLPGDTTNHFLLFGTAGLHAAGGPTPDYTIPDQFLFAAGGTITFFGSNGGAYPALPTDGVLSRNWVNGTSQVNSPTSYDGHTGQVPSPGPLGAAVAGAWLAMRRRRRA